MKKICFFAFLFVLFVTGCATYNKRNPYPGMEIFQYDGARAYVFENPSSDKLIINIEGSGWTSVLGLKGEKKWYYAGVTSQLIQIARDKYTVFTPEKWDRVPEVDYSIHFESKIIYTLDNLLECYLTSINRYLAEHHYESIILMGTSEGAMLLPLIYEAIKDDHNITGMISWGFGGLSLYESYLLLKDSEIVPEDYRVNIQYFVDMYETDNIDAYKTDAFPLTFMDVRPFDHYKNINIPVLFIHGELDFNVSVESTRFIQNNLPEKPFEYIYYADMIHIPVNYSQIMRVRKDIVRWLNKQEAKHGEIDNPHAGIYLPEYYLTILSAEKSHAAASDKLGKYNKKTSSAVIIFRDNIFYIYNFHEWVDKEIITINENEIIPANPYNEGQYIDLAGNNTIKDENGVSFICINSEPYYFRDYIPSYITKIIFGDRHYANNNGEEIYRLENGNIVYKNREYELNLDSVFSNAEYDSLTAEDNDTIHFRVIDETVVLYRQDIPERYAEHAARAKYAQYTETDKFFATK
jgi:esterase/lipase